MSFPIQKPVVICFQISIFEPLKTAEADWGSRQT